MMSTTYELITIAVQRLIFESHPSELVTFSTSTLGSILTGVIGFGIKYLRDLNRSVTALNASIEILIKLNESQDERLIDHEMRLREAERLAKSEDSK
jgi:adenosine/AMP kinase